MASGVMDWAQLPVDQTPRFWRDEVSGVLEGPITRYLEGNSLSLEDIRLIGLYLQQWIDSPAWDLNPDHSAESRAELAALRLNAHRLRRRGDIDVWLFAAIDYGADPL